MKRLKRSKKLEMAIARSICAYLLNFYSYEILDAYPIDADEIYNSLICLDNNNEYVEYLYVGYFSGDEKEDDSPIIRCIYWKDEDWFAMDKYNVTHSTGLINNYRNGKSRRKAT